jgi:hypothetical protein
LEPLSVGFVVAGGAAFANAYVAFLQSAPKELIGASVILGIWIVALGFLSVKSDSKRQKK